VGKKRNQPNRTERRVAMNEDIRADQLRNLEEKSLPTHKPVLDVALHSLFQAVMTLTELSWSMEEIVEKSQSYRNITLAARERYNDLSLKSSGELSEEQINLILLQETLLTRYADDLSDDKVTATISLIEHLEAKEEAAVKAEQCSDNVIQHAFAERPID